MADRPALDLVIFDAGGTLVRLDFEWMAEVLTEAGFPTDAGTLRRAEIEGRRAYDHSRRPPGQKTPPLGGPGDVMRYFGGMIEAVGVPADRTAKILERFVAREQGEGLWSRPMEGARAAIDGVAALGLRRAVISNSDGRAEWHLVNAGVREGLEMVIDSFLVGIEKPDPAIFHLGLERLGVPARRALYVGDIRSVDEMGSAAAGMHFVLIDPSGSYRAPGGPSVRTIDELPAWIVQRFDVPHTPATHSSAGGG